MQGLWGGLGVVSYALMALSGGANALYFARRAVLERGARRLAAVVLVAVFAGVALDGSAQLLAPAPGAAESTAHAAGEALRRAPLITSALLVLGARR